MNTERFTSENSNSISDQDRALNLTNGLLNLLSEQPRCNSVNRDDSHVKLSLEMLNLLSEQPRCNSSNENNLEKLVSDLGVFSPVDDNHILNQATETIKLHLEDQE